MTEVTSPYQLFADGAGTLVEGGYLYVGQPDNDPETAAKLVFWDEGRTIPALQPLRTTGGVVVRDGTPARFFVDGDYSLRLRQRDGSVVFYYARASASNVLARLAASDGASLVGFRQSGSGAADRTTQAKMRERISLTDFLPPDYVTDGSVDYTSQAAAWIAECKAKGAEAWVPRGFWNATLDVVGPLRIRGEGNQRSAFKKAGRVLNIRGEFIDVADCSFWSTGGDHCVWQSGLVSQSTFQNVHILQKGNAHSVWDNAAHEFIDMRFMGCRLEHTTASTVPAFNLVNVGGTINDNSWVGCRIQFSGNAHFFNIESTNANAHYSNKWADLTWEVCLGGGIRLRAVNGYIIDNCQNWDADTVPIRNHFYDIDSANGIGSVGRIADCGRWAGTMASGKVDLKLPGGGGGAGTIMMNNRTAGGGDPFRIDAANNGVILLRSSANVCSAINDTGVMGFDASMGFVYGANKVVGTRGAGIPDVPMVTSGNSPTAGDHNGLVQSFNALLGRLRGSSGHGLIGG